MMTEQMTIEDAAALLDDDIHVVRHFLDVGALASLSRADVEAFKAAQQTKYAALAEASRLSESAEEPLTLEAAAALVSRPVVLIRRALEVGKLASLSMTDVLAFKAEREAAVAAILVAPQTQPQDTVAKLSEVDYRRDELARLVAEHQAEVEAGENRFAAIYAKGIATLEAQLATYTDDKGEAHFVDAEGFPAAMAAFGEVAEIRAFAAAGAYYDAQPQFYRDRYDDLNRLYGDMADAKEQGNAALVAHFEAACEKADKQFTSYFFAADQSESHFLDAEGKTVAARAYAEAAQRGIA